LMTRGTALRISWALWTLATGAMVAAVVLAFVGGLRPGDELFLLVLPAFQLAASTVGALVASRHPTNAIGWLFLGEGVVWGLSSLGTSIAGYALGTDAPVTSFVRFADWVGVWLFVPGLFIPITFLLLLFPDGRLPSRRWRPVAWLSVVGIAMVTLGNAFGPLEVQDAVVLRQNPYAFGSQAVWRMLESASWFVGFAAMVGSAAALIIRLRRSRGDERQQLKWLAYAGLVVAFLFLLAGVAWGVFSSNRLLTTIVLPAVMISALLLIPIAAGMAILRHGLYEIDVVINKTVVYGLLAAVITALYVGIVVGVGALVGRRGGIVLPGVAAATVALVFQPVRRWAQHLANRLVYGKRATPYEVLSEFSDRLAGEYAVEDVLPRMARIVGEGTGAARASVWLRVGGELRRASLWSPGSDGEGLAVVPDVAAVPGDSVLPVQHQGLTLGALAVEKPRGEPLTPGERKLLADLAAQAGLILRNVRLVEELRASRQRIVAAQDAERRRLERDIHDGAQQQLVALSVKARLAEKFLDRDRDKARRTLEEIKLETTEALENLRDLARGIYPPLLADQGLAAALESQARKATVPVEVRADGIGRLPQEVEAGVYFCVLEALQNVAKYAGASRAVVRLGAEDGDFAFEVSDDGRGFDPASTPPGSGLHNMRDRIEALGGNFEIRSEIGAGTRVTGRVPVASREGGPAA
jgi:signal transduction histidine kinase